VLDTLIASLAGMITVTISTLGYGGIVILMAIESACIPLPSEIIMPFSGYLAFTGRFDLFLVATAGALGCNVGSTLAYAVGFYGGRPFVDRWGPYVLMSRRDLDRAHSFFVRFGGITVFVSRLLPVIRTFIALPAGIAGMPQLKFQVYTFLGSWLWCYALAYIGFKLGERWNSDPLFKEVLHRFDGLVVAAMILGIGWYIWRHWKHRLKSRD